MADTTSKPAPIGTIIAGTLALAFLGGLIGGFIMAYQGKDVPQWIIGVILLIPPAFLGWLAPAPQLANKNSIDTNAVTDMMKAAAGVPPSGAERPNADLQPPGTIVHHEPVIDMNGQPVGTFTGKA